MKNKRGILVAVVVVALCGVVWAILPASPDPQVVKVQQLQAKLFESNAKMNDAERQQAFRELREESDKLTEEQRDQMMKDFRENPPEFIRQRQKEMADFFTLSPEEQNKALDKQIDEWEARRKQWEANRGNRPPGGPGGWGNRGNMDEKSRNDMRKKMLDNTTPQQRAMMSEYFDRMNQRRRERGLPPMGPGRR